MMVEMYVLTCSDPTINIIIYDYVESEDQV